MPVQVGHCLAGKSESALQMLVDKLNLKPQCALLAKKASQVLDCISKSVANRTWLYLQCCVQFCVPRYKK